MDASHGTPPKFYDLSLEQRRQWLIEHTNLTPEDIAALSGQAGLSA